MARAKDNGSRGFIKEIESPSTYKQPINKAEKRFDYSKALTPKANQSVSMNTPRRLSQHKAVAPAKSTLCEEQRQHIAQRQGKK